MATATIISRSEMDDFLRGQGFTRIGLSGVNELVYSRFVDDNLCQRVYTTIEGERSRANGKDAIRCVLVTRIDGETKIIGVDKPVFRVMGWKQNLQDRLDNWTEQLGPRCPNCQAPTVQRTSRRGPFWGCCRYPVCKSAQPVRKVVQPRHEHRLPASHPAVEASRTAWEERMQEKSAFARLEAEQEAKAYRDEMLRELEASGIYDRD